MISHIFVGSDLVRFTILNSAREYGGWTGPELGALCREKGSPWDECYAGEYGVEIPDESIRRHCESEMVTFRLPGQADMPPHSDTAGAAKSAYSTVTSTKS